MGTLSFTYVGEHAHLQDVDDQGKDVADEEDQDNHHQHCRQANLLLLQPVIWNSYIMLVSQEMPITEMFNKIGPG